MKKYMISYFRWKDGEGSGFGNTYVSIDENDDIYTQKSIEELEKQIKMKFSFSGIVIQNIIPLNK